jgi:hypothetical protein
MSYRPPATTRVTEGDRGREVPILLVLVLVLVLGFLIVVGFIGVFT